MALGSLTGLKLHLGISDTSQDTLLTALESAAEAAVLNYVGRPIEQASYTDYYSGAGQRDLALRVWPVSLTVDPVVYLDSAGYWGQGSGFASDTQLTLGTDFAMVRDRTTTGEQSRCGLLRKLGLGLSVQTGRPYASLATRYRQAVWPVGEGNIKVTYTAGYATVPGDITTAVYQLAATVYNTRAFGGGFLASERLGEYSQTLTSALNGNGAMADAVGSVAFLLRPYLDLTV